MYLANSFWGEQNLKPMSGVVGYLIMINFFTQVFGELGYDCQKKCCIIIPSLDGPGFGANNTINVIGITIPSIIILISYLKIWLQWRRNKKNLKSIVMNKTGQEDVKLGFSMLLICISFMTFSSLLIIYELVLRSNNSGSSMVFLCLFWFQFYSNFLIYAIWNVVFCKSFCPYSSFRNKTIDANIIHM